MRAMKTSCPNCGANIVPPKKTDRGADLSCRYCGTLLHLEPEQPPVDSVNSAAVFWKIEISPDQGAVIKGHIKGWKFLFFLPGILVPLLVVLHTSTSFYLPGIFTGGHLTCTGVERLILVNKKISSVTAGENCQVVLNNVAIESDATAITAEGSAFVTMVNSRIIAMETAISVKESARINAVNSSIQADDTALRAAGRGEIRLTSSTAGGKKNLYVREAGARIKLVSTATRGERIEKPSPQ